MSILNMINMKIILSKTLSCRSSSQFLVESISVLTIIGQTKSCLYFIASVRRGDPVGAKIYIKSSS